MAFGFDELDGAKGAAEDLANTFSVWAEECSDDTELTPAQRDTLKEQLNEIVEAVQELLKPHANASTLLGLPVVGEIEPATVVAQRPLSELEPLLAAVLHDPAIAEVGWLQFTPEYDETEFYSKEDPREFQARWVWVRSVDDLDVEEICELLVEEHRSLGQRAFNRANWNFTGPYTGPDQERFDRCLALNDALSSRAFDEALKLAFGENARVTVTSTEIRISRFR